MLGGYRLAITCRGKGSPTVILESGGGASAEAWFLLERIVAETTVSARMTEPASG